MGGRRRPGVRESGASVTARLEDLEGNLVALDTAPVIYLVEAHPVYQDVARPFFDALETGRLRMVTSILTLLEVLVYPLRQDNPTLAARYRDILLATRGLSVLDATESIIEEAARVRAAYNLGAVDSIQVATAIVGGASYFLTNDARLARVPELNVLVLDQLR